MSTPSFSDRFNPDVARAITEATKQAPFPALLGLSIDDVQPGLLVCSLPVRPELMSGVGALHGGALTALVDHALSLAVYPLVEPGKWVATLESKVNFLEAVRGGELTARARVVSLKTRVAVVSVEVENEGRLAATAQGTLYIRER
jgi:uncharacterized protein (TIGR00369 family)